MARRIIAIPLAVAIAIAVFLYPVMGALPENNIITDILLSIDVDGVPYTHSMQTGQVLYAKGFDDISYSHFNVSYNFKLSSTVDVYLIRSSSALIENNTLISYADSSAAYDETITTNYNLVSLVGGTTDWYLDPQSSTYTYNIRVLKYSNVPMGSHSFDIVMNTGTLSSNYWCVGVYIDSSYLPVSDVVDDYINGNIGLKDALEQINNNYQNNIKDLTGDELQLQTIITQYEIERLIQASNNKSISDVQSTVQPSMNQQITDYVSGSQTLEEAIDGMYTEYSSALAAAETPEQGILVNTTYQISLKKLELQARQKAYERLDSAITDEQLTEADEYYQSEEGLINMFEVAEFESALDFQLWVDALPPAEATEYKQFFDYILNESSIRMFLIVPISLVLVRIIFGTALHLRVRQ